MHFLLSAWRPVLEVLILWYVFYHLLVFIKGTPAVQVLKGLIFLIILFLIFLFIAQKLNLAIISWILPRFFAVFLLSFLIIFQPELRRGLAKLGQGAIMGLFFREERIIDEITEAVFSLAQKKIGAIIALERDIGLKPYIESGVALDSKVSSELIQTIFVPPAPLHDGGIIVQNGRIVAAGCLFPLTQHPKVSKSLGTRHRAAIGLTDQTDAVVIVASEESGAVSLVRDGRLTRVADKESLTKTLNNIFTQPKKTKISFKNILRVKSR